MSKYSLTVKQLLDFIEKHNIPMDAVVRYERIEDSYFKKGTGWGENSTLKPDDYNIGTDQYIDAFTPIKYPDDNNLYITAHY